MEDIKDEQNKVKDEIKQFITQDVILKMQSQIKNLVNKFKNDDPLFTKTKLDKCASCLQTLHVNQKLDDDKYSPRHNNSPNKTK